MIRFLNFKQGNEIQKEKTVYVWWVVVVVGDNLRSMKSCMLGGWL